MKLEQTKSPQRGRPGKRNPTPAGLNDGHVHEVVDRLHVIICTIEDHVTNHPLVQATPAIGDKIDRAVALLAEAYQQAGSIGLDENPAAR